MSQPTLAATRRNPHRLFLVVMMVLMACGILLAAKARAAQPSIGPDYLRLTPIAFSVIGQDNKVDLEVSIALALELKPGITESMVSPYEHKIQDQILVALSDLCRSSPMSRVVTRWPKC